MGSAEANFATLGKVFLDPLVSEDNISEASIYELVGQELIRRDTRGARETEPILVANDGDAGWALMNRARKLSGNELFEPIAFGTHLVGVLIVKFDDPPTDGETEKCELLAAELAPLMAWTTAPWSSRLSALQFLWEMKNKYENFNWVGIYRLTSDNLVLSSFFGKPTEHTHIPEDAGICGAAVQEGRTINIANVAEDPRFIACSLDTQSELVVPIRDESGTIVAEIDIDSDTPDAFEPELVAYVESYAAKLGKIRELFS